MKKFDFVIGYDIASSKRLRRVATLLESEAIRIQLSLFFYPKQTQEAVKGLVKSIVELIDPNEDDVRIYRVDIPRSLSLGSAVDLKYPNLSIEVE